MGSHSGPSSKFCAFTSASGYQWAELYLTIDDAGPYDASNTKGIGFWVHSDNPSYVRISVSDTNTDPAGGVCTLQPEGCGSAFGTDLYLSPTWTWKEILWSTFAQSPGGYHVSTGLATGGLYRIEWTAKPGSLNIWIDDPAFLLK